MSDEIKSEDLPDNSNIINIESIKSKNNISIKNKEGYFDLQLYLEDSIFYNDTEYNKFIKATEKLIRNSDAYSEYIAILKGNYGLNYCMFLGNVGLTDEKVTVEMHHGPILNLFEIVSIVTNSCLARKEKITTFRIADIVLREHFKHNIQVIMLSKTVHEAVHAGKIFIHPSQAIGNIQNFLDDYSDGLTEDMIAGINKYIEISEKNKYSTDNGVLKTNGVKEWKKDDDEDLTLVEDDDEEE